MLAITTQLIEEQNLCQSKSLLQPYKDTLQQQLGDKELLKCTINLYQHKDRDFMETEITIFNNAIVMGDQYILLSSTHNEMKYYKMKPHDCYIVILRNNLAKEVFYTHSETLFQKLQNIIKKFSITSNFIQKFQVLEHYGQLMTAQSQNGELFSVMQIDKADKEAFHNQITLWNYIQIQPNIIKICDDPKNYYLICQHLKLQSISNLLMQGFEMKEVQLVSIMFILLQTLQKYHNKGLYHGNLKIDTVFLNIQSATLQINSLFPQYKKQSQKSIQDDLFDLGVILFQISFFKDNHFQELDDGIIRECRQNLQNFSQNGQKFKFLYRISQIDLMLLLLNRTCTLEQAQRHHWFITIKQNLKQENQGRHIMHKTNLQTIVEQCESLSSSQMVDPLKRFISISVEQEPEDEKPLKGLVYDGIMAPSKAKHDHYARIGAFQQMSRTFNTFTHTNKFMIKQSTYDLK